MELLNGRPADAGDRLPREMRTYDMLDSLGIEYIFFFVTGKRPRFTF